MNDSNSIDSISSAGIIHVAEPLQKENIPDGIFFMFKTIDEDCFYTELIQYMTLAAARQRLREKGELI